MTFLFHSSYFDPDDWRQALLRELPDLDFRVWPDLGRPDEIECIMAWRPPAGTFPKLTNLKLIYATGAGVDGLLNDPERPKGIPIARVTSPDQARDMAAFVCGAVLRHHLQFDIFARQQAKRVWSIPAHIRTSDRCVGVMGLGNLGSVAARLLTTAHFRVRGWRRSPGQPVEGVETFVGQTGLDEFLRGTDILVCMLPLTSQTHGIINRDLLERLPAGAAVINVGRGAHLVESDLFVMLEDHLSGATLDVFETEPLPPEHPAWRHPRIFVTPHVATITNPAASAAQVAENLRRLGTGQPLTNIVDEVRGY